MRFYILFFLFFNSLASYSSDVLLEYKFQSGFDPRLKSELLQILDGSGEVWFERTQLDRQRNPVKTKKLVLTLSKETLQKIKHLSTDIQKGELRDLQEGEPYCSDSHLALYSVTLKTEEGFYVQPTRKYSNCHTYVLEQNNADFFVDLLNNFLTLALLESE